MSNPPPEPVEGAAAPAADPLSPRALAWRLAVGLVSFLAVVAALGLTLRGPVEAISAWFVAELGLVGIFAGVLVTDTLPFLVHEPLLLFGLTGGLGFLPVFAAAASASVLAGFVGYGLGRAFGRSYRLQRFLLRYRLADLLRRYGVAAIAVGALTPFPYAVTTWGAGAVGIPLRHLALGSLFRIPKVLFYLTLIALGWTATA